MSLILTTPPSGEPVTLAETKSHLRISHTDDDAYITRLITAARKQIEARLAVGLIAQNWSLFLDRWPQAGCVYIPLAPVIQVSDVITYGESDTPATLDPAHYYLDRVSRPARLALRSGRPFPQAGRNLNGIEIKLAIGYGTTPATVPDDLRQALLLTIAAWFANRGESESGALPLLARERIAPYRHMMLT
jgi:uncharacterized phiE125 gp8 family phage protein